MLFKRLMGRYDKVYLSVLPRSWVRRIALKIRARKFNAMWLSRHNSGYRLGTEPC